MPNFTNNPVISKTTGTNAISISGESDQNEGVRGVSHNAHGGVVGINDFSPASPPGAGGNGGWFESSQGEGVRGWSKTPYHGGVVGVNSAGGFGVYGQSDDGIGVVGESKKSEGLRGVSHSSHGGVVGVNDWSPSAPPGAGGNGGWFESTQGEGVRGTAKNPNHGGVVGVNTGGGIGIFGTSDNGVGIWSTSGANEAVHAETKSDKTAAIAAYQMNPASESAALYAKHTGKRTAAVFEGDVHITGKIEAPSSTMTCFDVNLVGADCAEEFEAVPTGGMEPGAVMSFAQHGVLTLSNVPYDKKVAGVISGAGKYKPGIVLDRQQGRGKRVPIALVGKVLCKVDAQYGAVEIGDLLTTSPTPGYGMKADDPIKAFGAVIGKALAPLLSGQDLIPIVVALG
jgi:hypothetical protein